MIRVVGAGCQTGLGDRWRGLSERLDEPAPPAVPVAGIPRDHGRRERLAERLMSRSAVLGHLATRAALADAGWAGDTEDLGFFMGVGASGGSVAQLEAMLSASVDGGRFCLERFGAEGLRACNPLYAFQLMNNLVMAHAAILAGTRGPNAALFSRGAGTVAALREAMAADCERVLAGGADTALDPVTEAELARSAGAVRPAEGAAVLALSRRASDPALAVIESAELGVTGAGDVDCAVCAGVGAPDVGEVVDLGAAIGEALAATPAIAWAVALDLLRRGRRRVAVLSRGIDGEVGRVILAAPPTLTLPRTRGRDSLRALASGAPGAGAGDDPVITGAGVISPFGRGLDALLDGLAGGRSAVGPIRAFDAKSFPTRVAAEVPAPVFEALEPPPELPRGAWRDRKLRFALAAAAEARAAAGDPDLSEARLALAVGLEQAFLEDFEQSFNNGQIDWDRERSASPGVRSRSPVDLTTAWVRRVLGIGGPAVTHVSACAAGALAVAHAADQIRRGEADIVVCGGADSMVNPLGIGGMSRLGATSPRAEPDACRPFDRDRDGLAMGEGAAVFVVESRRRAESRGVAPLAAICGWGSTQDGYKATAPRPDGSAAAAAMRRALRESGMAPADIGYINAHGTGTPLNDPVEVAAIRAALGEAAAAIPVSSIKGAVGHLMAAAGALEIAACLLPLRRDRLPGTAHLRQVDPRCDLDIVGPEPRAARVDAVLSNSFGFGGQNASVILGRSR